MEKSNTRRWLIRVIVGGVVLSCGGLAYLAYVAYRSVHVYVQTYTPTTSPTLNGGKVSVHVTVHHRIKSDRGDSLVGPPYWFRFTIPDTTGKATSGRLHSLRIIDNEGNELTAEITRGNNDIANGATSLYAKIEHGDLGKRPQLIADIELVMSGGSVREEITFSLRRGTSASLNIP